MSIGLLRVRVITKVQGSCGAEVEFDTNGGSHAPPRGIWFYPRERW